MDTDRERNESVKNYTDAFLFYVCNLPTWSRMGTTTHSACHEGSTTEKPKMDKEEN